MAITEFGGGYFLTTDEHILLTGEWRDYNNTRMRTFIAKLDKDLEIVWINYYPDLFEYHVYGEAIAETPSGDIMLYLTEGKSLPTGNPWQTAESWIRMVKTDALGNPIFSKIVQDTFSQTVGVLDYHFVPYPCDTTIFTSKAKDIYTLEPISIYPNPFNEKITLSSSYPLNGSSFLLYDQLGLLVHKQVLAAGDATIETIDLPPRIYFGVVGDGRMEKLIKTARN